MEETAVSEITLGEEYRNEIGGFAFQAIPGYTVEESFAGVGIEAPDADPAAGPAIFMMGLPGEEGVTNEQLLAEWRQDLEEGTEMANEREIAIGGVKGLTVDMSGTADSGDLLNLTENVTIDPGAGNEKTVKMKFNTSMEGADINVTFILDDGKYCSPINFTA